MGQGPIATKLFGRSAAGLSVPVAVTPDGELIAASQGDTVSFNKTAAAVIATGKGRVKRITLLAPGTTSGAWALNDNTAVGGTNVVGNQLWGMPYNSTKNVAGESIDLDLPFVNGLVLSAVPGSGSPIASISYTLDDDV